VERTGRKVKKKVSKKKWKEKAGRKVRSEEEWEASLRREGGGKGKNRKLDGKAA
jgi:hypothetical protein